MSLTFPLIDQAISLIDPAQAGPSATIYAMYGLDYEPRNAKEKWLLRIVYWGTILLVAFFFWEYVKAK